MIHKSRSGDLRGGSGPLDPPPPASYAPAYDSVLARGLVKFWVRRALMVQPNLACRSDKSSVELPE